MCVKVFIKMHHNKCCDNISWYTVKWMAIKKNRDPGGNSFYFTPVRGLDMAGERLCQQGQMVPGIEATNAYVSKANILKVDQNVGPLLSLAGQYTLTKARIDRQRRTHARMETSHIIVLNQSKH